jgi:hypothetical protein
VGIDLRAVKKANVHLKRIERILGDSDFVEAVLGPAQETVDCQTRCEIKGDGCDGLLGRVANLAGMTASAVMPPGRYLKTERARRNRHSRAHREPGNSSVGWAERLKFAQRAIRPFIKHGERLNAIEGKQPLEKYLHPWSLWPRFVGADRELCCLQAETPSPSTHAMAKMAPRRLPRIVAPW